MTDPTRRPAAKVARRDPCPWGLHQWREEKMTQRPGWWSTSCVICGKWLGARPDDVQRPRPGQRNAGGTYT